MSENHPIHLVNDPAVMADPFAAYAQWRRQGPVHPAVTPTGEKVWLVTRYDDVRQLLADPRLSLNKNASASGYRGYALPPALDANLLNMDPPDHSRLRRLVSKAFTPRRVQQLQPGIAATAERLIDQMIPAGQADLVAEFTTPLPLTVIGELLGVPDSDRAAFRAWTNDLVTPPSRDAARSAVTNMEQLLRSTITRKRAAPADDLISAMIAARDDHDQLTEDELTSLAFLVLWAGYEVSVDLLGVGVLALLQHRDQFDLLRTRPDLSANAVDELVRWIAPTPYAIRRFTTETVTIGDTDIPPGHTILLSLASAHRDVQRFAEADVLDISRPATSAHLGFGHGVHYCLGAPLARVEVAAALEALTRKLPHLHLACPAEKLQWRPSFRSRGLLALPVTF